jgi:hypothetical protein
MVPGLLDESFLNHAFPLSVFESVIAIVISIIFVVAIGKKFAKQEFFEDKSTRDFYLLIYFAALVVMFLAFVTFIKEPDNYNIGFICILISELLFWQALNYSKIKVEKKNGYHTITTYKYNSNIVFATTSLISILFLLFIVFVIFMSKVAGGEGNINIFGTLLLLSVFNTLYGIRIDGNLQHHYQLHVYSYLFILIAVVLTLTKESWFTATTFNFTAYLLSLYSANEISKQKDNKGFYLLTFKIMLFVLCIIGLLFSAYMSTWLPLATFILIGLVIVGTLVKMKEYTYNEDWQKWLMWSIILFCFILYYLLSGEIFILSNVLSWIYSLFEAIWMSLIPHF